MEIIEDDRGEYLEEMTLDAVVTIVKSPSDYLNALSRSDIWKAASTSSELEVAIALEAKSLAEVTESAAISIFRVGSEFLASLHSSQAIGQGAFADTALSKCAHIVTNSGLVNAQPFRTAAAANAGPRIRQRDGATAMRAHITGGHQALRLMYWLLPGGAVEFSCVRSKFDLQIDEGDLLGECGWSLF